MTITELRNADIALAPSEPLTCRFEGLPLPRGLREDADTMSWSTFTATYAPSAGPLRLGQWHCTDTDRRATRLGTRTFQATLALGDRIETATATATGPVAALTAMLYEHGVSVEMLRFHQLQSDDTTATFIRAPTAAGPSGRWAARRIRHSPHCQRSSPARTGCTAPTARAGAARSACRPSESACLRSPTSPDNPRGATQGGSGAAAGARSS